MKRNWILYVLLSGVFTMLGFVSSYHVPQLKSWILFQVSEYTQSNGPFFFFAQDLKFTFFPMGVEIQNIKMVPKSNIRKQIGTIEIDSVHAGLDPFTIFGGRFGLSEIIIQHPNVTFLVGDKLKFYGGMESGTSKNRVHIPIKEILKIPVHAIRALDVELLVLEKSTGLSLHLSEAEIEVQNRTGVLTTTIAMPKIEIKGTKDPNPLPLSLATRFQTDAGHFNLNSFKFQRGTSYFTASGTATGNLSQLQTEHVKINSSAHFELEPMSQWAHFLPIQIDLPPMSGAVDQKISLEQSSKENLKIIGESRAQELKFNSLEIGDLETHWLIQDQKLTSTETNIKNSAGSARIKNLHLDFDDSKKISADLNVPSLEIRQLLKILKVGDIPVHLDVSGDLPCEGQLSPILLNCSGTLYPKNFKVWNANSKRTLVAFKEMRIDGSVRVDDNGVFPKGTLILGNSRGEAEGQVLYKSGFKFQFHSPEFNFADLETLANLKFEGQTSMLGSTEGNSDTATLQMAVATKDLWFEDHGVGNVKSDVQYKSGSLFFRNIDGIYRTSHFLGSLTVDLDKATIDGKAKAPYLEINDLQRMFARKVTLPFVAIGSGVGEIQVSGPLEFNRLSYVVRSSIYNGTINDERFNEATFDVTSTNGHVVSDRIYFKKNNGIASLSGTGEPSGTINTVMEGRNFNLQDFQTLTQAGVSLAGDLNFSMSMKGHVLSPDADLKGTVSKTFIGADQLPDSAFETTFTKSYIRASGNFIGGDLILDAVIPFTESAPFKWDMTAHNWNFTPLFSFISNDVNTREFDARLTSKIHLEAPTGGFWKSNGTLAVSEFRIRRGISEVAAVNALNADFKQGAMSFPVWTLQGDGTLLKMEARGSSHDKLNISLNGKIEMNVLSFLTPFLSDLRGSLSLTTQLQGTASDPSLIGSAYAEHVYAKPKALPHAIEDLRADVLFNRRQLVINSFDGRLADGRVYGDGVIRFEALRNLPTDIHGQFEGVRLQIPANVQTTGSGDFRVTGSWFPFLFAANYNIQEGLFTKQFDDEETLGPSLKRSNLLPAFLTQRDIDVATFNILTNFTKGLRIKNQIMDADIVGQLTIKGPASKPVLVGDVNVKPGGKLFFRDSPFDINNAQFRFNEAQPNNPLVYLVAQTHINTYDISLLAQGSSKNIQLSLRSQPPMPEQDIVTLLALGVDPLELERARLRATAAPQGTNQQSESEKAAMGVGAALLSKNPVSKVIKKQTGVEVKFSSTVDQTDNTTSPQIVMSKEWTPKLKGSYSRTTGSKQDENIKLEYRLNSNVSAVGSVEKKSSIDAATSQSTDQQFFGLDLQYKVEFK